MESFIIACGQGRCRVELAVTLTGDGISVLLTGGEKSHVGGVVLCLPRPSLSGAGSSADAWVVPVPGHKDVILAELAGGIISRETGEAVAVTAGIHSDQASPAEIERITANCQAAAAQAAAVCHQRRCGG